MRPRTYQFGASAGAILAAAILSTVSATASVDTSTTLVNVPQGSDASNQDVIAAWGGNPILPGNLATTATVTLEAGSPDFGSAVANINDSLMVSSVSPAGGPYRLDNTGNAAAFAQAGDGGPAQLKVVLDGPRDLAMIDVFTSYQWERVGQKWAVYTSTDAGATWSATPLASVNIPDAGSLDFEVYQSRRVRVQGTTPGTAVAAGVNALRFDIYDTEGDPNGVSVFSEIAIYAVPGTVTVSSASVALPQGGASSNASIVNAWGGNPILPGNLAANAAVTLTAGSAPFGGTVANLKDGLMVSSVSPAGGPYVVDTTDNSMNFDNGADPSSFTMVFDASYNLARIDAFTSYQWSRTGQKWEVYTSSDGGATWSDTPLASVDYPNVDTGWYDSRRVTVSDSGGTAAIASNVNALRFDVYETDTSAGGNAVAIFSEIAVYAVPGTVTVSSASVALPQGGASSNASIVNAWGGNPILPGNLAANAAVTLTAGSAPFGGTVANLKDGLMVSSVSPAGGPYVVDTTDNSMNFDNASSFTMVFDASYNLTRIDVFTSYAWNRTGQKWEVYTSSDGGATWSDTPLASVDYPNVNTGGYDSRRVTVSDSGGTAAIASNVNALRFDVYDTDTGGGGDAVAIFSEIAVYAVPGQLTVSSSLVGIPQGGGSSNADIVNAWGGNPILSGNLATNATITLLSGDYPFGGSVANLKDGLMLSSVDPVGGPYQLENTANSAAFDNGDNPSQVELVLDGTYNLTRIDVFTSYAWNRTGQKWEVFTSTDGGATWSETALASVDYGNQTVATWQSRRTTLVGSSGTAIIAPGVNALRFDIYDTDTGGGGDAEAVFSEIAVYGAAPGPVPPSGLSYAPSSQTGTVGTSITSMIPTVTGTVTGYSVSPALPSGLLLDAVTGTISGTPSAAAATATYTVTAANAGGSTTATVSIGVQSAYEAWAQGAPLDSTNLLLYAIGGASGPAATNGVAPVTVVNSNLLSIVAVVRTNDPSLTVRGQSILNLSSGTWITNDVTMNPSVDQAGVPSGTQRQIFSTPRATNDTRKFLRLQTTLAP